MIALSDMEKTAKEHLKTARLLCQKQHARFDAAVYLCGYAIEIALKARICRTLGWVNYPFTNSEFDGYRSFQTHNFKILLHLSGVEAKIMSDPALQAEWSVVLKWNPEMRYTMLGTTSAADAADMIDATKKILKVLL